MVTKKKYQLCAFHTARRSFASILAAKGVPVAEISQFMSHSSLSMTERYIKVDTKKISEEALSFFNS
jgi:integrase